MEGKKRERRMDGGGEARWIDEWKEGNEKGG